MPRARRKNWELTAPRVKRLTKMEPEYPAEVMDRLLGDEFLRVGSSARREECRAKILEIVGLFEWQRNQESRPTTGEKLAALRPLTKALHKASQQMSMLDGDGRHLVMLEVGRLRLLDEDETRQYGYSTAFLKGFKDGGAQCLGERAVPEFEAALKVLSEAAKAVTDRLSALEKTPLAKPICYSEADAVASLIKVWRSTASAKKKLTVKRLRDFAVTALTPVYESRGEPASDLLRAAELALIEA